MEELREILAAVEKLGVGGKEAFIAWLWFHVFRTVVNGIVPIVVFVTVVLGVKAILLKLVPVRVCRMCREHNKEPELESVRRHDDKYKCGALDS